MNALECTRAAWEAGFRREDIPRGTYGQIAIRSGGKRGTKPRRRRHQITPEEWRDLQRVAS